jgi:NAD(P)-dependent dehydrogenase (short-subunit alcohol dehydrogenase family)
MTGRNAGRVAMVTGGRQGIGRGIALAMADAGFDIVLIDIQHDERAEETLADIERKANRRAVFLAGNIGDVDRHPTLVDAAFSAFGTVDCLVNNAGVQVDKRGDLLDATVESYDRVMGVNLRGTFFLTQAVARRMIGERNASGSGTRSIVTISSVNVDLVSPDRPEYCMSKLGLSMMTKMFALRLAPHGICVYEVRPGITATPMTAVAREKYDRLIGEGLVPMGRWGQPEDVGRTVAALAGGLMPFSTGGAYTVDGGLHIPKF